MDTRFDRLDGLYKTIIIATSQTICQINKYYQTRVWGIYSYMGRGVYRYIHYRGRGVSSIYRPIQRISHTETLNVSNNGTGGYRRKMGGYIKRYQLSLLAYIHTYGGYMV